MYYVLLAFVPHHQIMAEHQLMKMSIIVSEGLVRFPYYMYNVIGREL